MFAQVSTTDVYPILFRKPLDPRAKRYIMSFRCAKTFVSNNMEFVVLEIKGQSFMLHQIRKMVAFAVAIARNIVSEETLNLAFDTKKKMDIAIAPSLGLCLCHVRNVDCVILFSHIKPLRTLEKHLI